MERKKIIVILGGALVVVSSFMAGGYFLADQNDEETTTSYTEKKQSDIFTSEMLNDEKTLISAIAWYGYEQRQEPQWYAWKNSQQVDHMDLNKMRLVPDLSQKGDKQYYQFQPKKKSQTICGFTASKDQQTFYLYAFRDDDKKVKPLLTVKRSTLLKELNEQKVREDILNYSGKVALSTIKIQKVKKVVEEVKKERNEDNPLWNSEQAELLQKAMTELGEKQHRQYEEVGITTDENKIPFNDVTICNQLNSEDEALLSIDSQFEKVDTSLNEKSDNYQIVAAYNGVSDDIKNMRYLFVLKDGQPYVLSSDIHISIGAPNGKRAANFVETRDEELAELFTLIVESRQEEEAEEKEEQRLEDEQAQEELEAIIDRVKASVEQEQEESDIENSTTDETTSEKEDTSTSRRNVIIDEKETSHDTSDSKKEEDDDVKTVLPGETIVVETTEEVVDETETTTE